MATVYGLLTKKSSNLNQAFENRYYVSAETLQNAQIVASSIIDAEQIFMWEGINWTYTHAWVPNSTPNVFSNVTRNETGMLESSNPISSFITAEFLFGTESSYIHRKRFRVQLDSNTIQGTQWSPAYMAFLNDGAESFSELLTFMTTKTGEPLTSVAINPFVTFTQVSKRWYNLN